MKRLLKTLPLLPLLVLAAPAGAAPTDRLRFRLLPRLG
jgi:hypothetical protein